MTTTVTKDQIETLSSADNGQAVSETQKYTGEFEGKFIGTLVGNATTAKQLEQPYNFSLAGDAEGTVAVNASSVVLNTTVNHATEADTADFAGKTNLAARATLADMANTAEFAYRAGRLSNLLIKLHGGVTGSGQLTNADTMDIAISGVDVSYFFVFSALPEKNPDITKAYVDLSGHHFWIYDTANTVWKDAYEYLTKTLELHGQRLDVLEQSKTTNTADIETLKSTVSQHGAKLTNHEDRITVNERGISTQDARITTNSTDISALDKRLTAAEKLNTTQSESIADHEKRIGNIETTTDVGQITVRVQAIEDKNVEQDTALDNETKARVAKEKLLDAKDTELTNALADEKQAREQKDTSLETKNTEQDGRLDAIETKNTEQDKSIKTNTTNINANANSISGLNGQVTEINSHLGTIDTHLGTIDKKNTAQDTNISNNAKSITDLSKSLIAKTSGLWLDTETMHNNIYRGADLLSAGHFSSISDIISAIADGNFEDIFVGDYFNASYTVDGEQKSTNFRIAGINYFKAAVDDWGVHTNHVCIVPDCLGTSNMNDTAVVTGGYIGSKMYTTVLPKYYAALAGSAGTPFFGHIKSMKESLSNAVDTQVAAAGGMAGWKGATSGLTDVANISLCLMSELEIYGCRNVSSAGDNFKNAAQLPMFRLNPNTITVWGTQDTWLRSISHEVAFCGVGRGFHAVLYDANSILAVRPRFAIG